MVDKKEEENIFTCIRCSYVTQDPDQYCIRCGAPVQNRCSDEPGLLDKGCKFVNKPNAAYCAKCGQPTVFLKAGLVNSSFP